MPDEKDFLWKMIEETVKNAQKKIEDQEKIKQNADADLLMSGIMTSMEMLMVTFYAKNNTFAISGSVCDKSYSREAINLCIDKLRPALSKKYPQKNFKIELIHYITEKDWQIRITW